MRIIKATKKDIDEIAEIEYSSCYKWRMNKQKTLEMIKESWRYCEFYILEKDNQPVGYFAVSFNKNKKICSLDYLAIKKKFQGKGLSKLMLNKVISISKTKKCKAIELGVWEKNLPAISLYNKFGFKNISVKKKHYPNGDDKLMMKKEVK